MIRKLSLNGEGYVVIGLGYDNKRQAGVHIYVAEAFIPNPENKPTVIHKYLVRHDNRVENLEWATMKEQNEHKRKPEKRATTPRPVWKCDKDTGERIKRYDSSTAAAQDLGLTSEISSVANRITIAMRGFFMLRGVKRDFKQAYGFCWQLAYDDLEGEIWKDVDAELLGGMAGYLASNMGRIRTLRGRITYGHKGANGYMTIDVRNPDAASSSNGDDEDSSDEDASDDDAPDEDAPDESGDDWRRLRHGVHRVIGTTFIPNPLGKPEVNHDDGNRENNAVSNLRWVTYKENSQHAYDTGLNTRSRAVEQLTLDGDHVDEFLSLADAYRATGVKDYGICNAIKYDKPTGGFRWKYIDGAHLVKPGDYEIVVHPPRPPAEPIVPVEQLALDGTVVAEFKSATEAELKTGHTGLSSAIRDRTPRKGFYWRRKPETPEAAPVMLPSRNNRAIQQLTPEGVVIQGFISIKDAAEKTGVNAGTITSGISTMRPAAKFLWRYTPTQGDEMARMIAAPNDLVAPVRQLTVDGVFIADHESIAQAVKATGVAQANISYGLKVGRPVSGFLWERGEKRMGPRPIKKTKPPLMKVQQLSLQGDFIARFDTVRLASEATGVNGMNIRGGVKSGNARGGFIWKSTEA